MSEWWSVSVCFREEPYIQHCPRPMPPTAWAARTSATTTGKTGQARGTDSLCIREALLATVCTQAFEELLLARVLLNVSIQFLLVSQNGSDHDLNQPLGWSPHYQSFSVPDTSIRHHLFFCWYWSKLVRMSSGMFIWHKHAVHSLRVVSEVNIQGSLGSLLTNQDRILFYILLFMSHKIQVLPTLIR